MTPSKVLLYLMLSFIGGIFIASFFAVPRIILYELLFLAILYGLVFIKNKRVVVFGFCLLFLFLGLWRGGGIIEPSINSYSQEQGNFLFLKDKLQNTIDKSLSPPQSGILSAILLGNKQELSKEFKEKLNIAGIRHITAISGMHIVILSSILLSLGIGLGLYRGQAFYFATSFLWLFILMVGFQPSAIRAGIMGSVFLLAEKLGRQKTADRTLFLTAGVMLAINPSLLRYSIGFQLSFLATLGIIYLMAPIHSILNKIMEGVQLLPQSVIGLLSMSFAAQIFVLPVLVYHFGQFSIISPLTNLLVVPLLPFLMGAGFLFIILGSIWWPLGFIFLFPVWLMLTYITKLTKLFAGLSFSALNFQIHWLWLPIIYGILTIIIWRIKRRQKLKLLP